MYIITLVRQCPLGSGKCTKRCVAIGPPKKARQIMSTSEADLHKVASMQEAKLAIPYSDTFAIPICSNKWSQTTDSPIFSIHFSFPLLFLFPSSSLPLLFLSLQFSFPLPFLFPSLTQICCSIILSNTRPWLPLAISHPPSPSNSDTFGFE